MATGRNRVGVTTRRLTKARPLLCLIALGVAPTVAGCKSEEDAGKPRPPESLPASVRIEGTAIVEGFAFGRFRNPRTIAAFELSVHPVSVEAFRECRTAGACSKSADDCSRIDGRPLGGPNATESEAPPGPGALEAPALCVGRLAAAQFCEWVGGRLPSLGEWLLGARGPDVRRFSWGDKPGNCAQYPRAPGALPPTGSPEAQDESCLQDPTLVFVLGKHPKGASVYGIQDVLLAPGELVSVDAGTFFGACSAPHDGCIVTGSSPGSIESVEPLRRGSSTRRTPYAFRCAWSTATP